MLTLSLCAVKVHATDIMYETRNIIKIKAISEQYEFEFFPCNRQQAKKSYFFVRNQNNAIFTSKLEHTSTVGCLNFLIIFPIGESDGVDLHGMLVYCFSSPSVIGKDNGEVEENVMRPRTKM